MTTLCTFSHDDGHSNIALIIIFWKHKLNLTKFIWGIKKKCSRIISPGSILDELVVQNVLSSNNCELNLSPENMKWHIEIYPVGTVWHLPYLAIFRTQFSCCGRPRLGCMLAATCSSVRLQSVYNLGQVAVLYKWGPFITQVKKQVSAKLIFASLSTVFTGKQGLQGPMLPFIRQGKPRINPKKRESQGWEVVLGEPCSSSQQLSKTGIIARTGKNGEANV